MQFASNKVRDLPAYLFSVFQQKKKQLEAKGVDVIDLGIGAPDLPTPDFICQALSEAVKDSNNHRYSTYSGSLEYRRAVASFYKNQYGVSLDPEKEVLALIGSKEGIVNLIQAVINPGDKVLIANPSYPVYETGIYLAGGKKIDLPLNKNYEPLFDNISTDDADEAKLMLLNYPNNPTTATIDVNTFHKAITLAKKHSIVITNDAAYQLVTCKDYKAPSILEVPNAKEYAIEFGSLSKSFNMSGWRIGYVAGNKDLIQSLATLKSNIDTSQFLAIQKAAQVALESNFQTVQENNRIYEKRIEKLYAALQKLGFSTQKPRGTFFLWVKVPAGYTSMGFANELLDNTGVMVTPGIAFGEKGEGYVRIALTVTLNRLDEVIRRLKLWKMNEVDEI
ncbi:aminotransferase class I/II-fold pyridoxal phosphate-dependent enzyme [Oceanobacillus senegalensis]|uniref:aminotransferase class I/II-fold pyridoxal phosphate-dependent enzyme n=1 Tax=Oceanobacillus senegalensis TaxID=1936063 RepID=UPI000A307749|nr:aminotransferase class I/II-fold pyridoxal phosphate-dependent enzyme [Oceanobacillus senegalensis]